MSDSPLVAVFDFVTRLNVIVPFNRLGADNGMLNVVEPVTGI